MTYARDLARVACAPALQARTSREDHQRRLVRVLDWLGEHDVRSFASIETNLVIYDEASRAAGG